MGVFARHFETGAEIPDALFQKMTAARNFRSACATAMRQVAFAKLDLFMHIGAAQFAGENDLEPRLRSAIADCLIPTEPAESDHCEGVSTHLFSRSDRLCGWVLYSYKWAEVLEADAFTRFRREGIFSAAVGRGICREDLKPGQLGRSGPAFPRLHGGCDPDLGALLARSGLAA